MPDDVDLAEDKTGNLLVLVRLPVDAVTPEVLRDLLENQIPIPAELKKTGFNYPDGPTIVQVEGPLPPVAYNPKVVIVEAERFVELPPDSANPDTYKAVSMTPSWGIDETGVKDSEFFGEGVSLAVLDSGLDFFHPDFHDRVKPGDWHDFTGTGIDDLLGHGTYCAGIAAGPAIPKHVPRYGVASDARLLIGKVFDITRRRCPDFDILSGMIWAALRGADVISLSWGIPVSPGQRISRIYRIVARALLNMTETIIVCSTGNSGSRPLNPRPIFHPADCPTVLAIAGLNPDLSVANNSCKKIGAQRYPSLSGPGVNVPSAMSTRNRPDWPWGDDDGTSAAAAFVAGISVLWAQQSKKRGSALRNLVLKRFRILKDCRDDVGFGLSIAP